MYLDPSALVKRYVAEPGSDLVRESMDDAEFWFICRVGFVETIRAIGLVAGVRAARAAKAEWSTFGVIEVDQALVEHAAALALEHDLRSLDSIHLAAALMLPRDNLKFVTWDRRLHQACDAEGLELIPQRRA
ncbi:MAG: type II toxin-antitoxin system VapC family toxin [Actinobacteria bacterium]|nr:type II toxin-antitoxin system VapC family toxin [Actinomycetota bacterium]